MRVVGSVITLICGIVVIAGVFLTWLHSGQIAISGWNLTTIDNYFNKTFWETYLVLTGGILTAAFALLALIISLAAKGGRAAVVTFGILAIVGSLVAVGGGVWCLVDAARDHLSSYVAYGFYITFAAAIIGFIFAILTAAFPEGRED